MNIGLGKGIAFGTAAGLFFWAAYTALAPDTVLPPDHGEPGVQASAIAAEQPVQRAAPVDAPAGSGRAAEKNRREQAQSLVSGEEIAILGQFMRVRELREEGEDFSLGNIRNLEFVFRPGIQPRRLFDDREKLVLSYRQLYRNNVGYGAATQFLFYQVVSRDSDGDGLLTPRDALEVAVSRPDGSDYRVLDRNLQAVLGVEHLPAENVLRLELVDGGSRVSRNYSLPSE